MFKLSHILFIFFIPLCTLAAEEEHPSLHFSIIINPLPAKEQAYVEKLYALARANLFRFNASDKNYISTLLTLMKKVSTLKSNTPQLNETYIGSFAYTQQQSWLDSINRNISPYHVAVFFFRLREYNSLLNKSNTINPTIDEWMKSQYNAKLSQQQGIALKKGETFGIYIQKSIIDYKKPPFQPINDNVAVEDFLQLTKNCEKLVNERDIEVVKTLADTIYLNILAPKTIVAGHSRL